MATMVFATDPLCGWCHGFAPILSDLRRGLRGKVRWKVACGGLFTGARERPLSELAPLLLSWGAEVRARTGARVGEGFRAFVENAPATVLRSEPGCRAILCTQELHGAEKAMDFAFGLAAAFYGDGLLPDAEETLHLVSARMGLDSEGLVAKWRSRGALESTRGHFEQTRSQGVSVYPSLFLETVTGFKPVLEGYREKTEAERAVERALTTLQA